MNDVTGALIALAAATPTDEARALTRLSLHDWTACALAGRGEPVARALHAKAVDEGGAAQATLLGGGRVPAARAALVNGATSHALDYDDTHLGPILHTAVAVFPAALATAERQGADLTATLDAALIGMEGAVRTGLWLGRDHYRTGFHMTATAGAFGATLAAGRLLSLDAGALRRALGLVASRASGLKAQFGTMAKPLNAGLAAEAGVEAALWSQAGLTAAADGLAGPQGFGPTHHGIADASALDGIGQVWLYQGVSHKFHACCHGLHATIEALTGTGLDAADIAQIAIRTAPGWLRVCDIAAPATGLEAKFSYRLAAAMALTGVPTGAIGTYSDALAADPDLAALRDRVSVAGDAALSDQQAHIRVTLHDGTAHDYSHDLATPMILADRQDRLRAKARALLGDGAEARLWRAGQGADPAALTALF